MKETTTSPLMIMLINMTIVFAVLYALGWVIKLIRYIDPTRKKEAPQAAPAAPAPVTAPAAAPVAATVEARQEEDDLEIAAVIAAAVAAYGYQASQIIAVRPVGGHSWANAARLEGVNARSQMS